MKIKLGLFLPVLAILSLALASAGPAAARAKPDYKAYGSCADGKPFKASRQCRYDGGRHFRATFVFKSNVGKQPLKACFRAYGPKPVGGGHACGKLGARAYKAYPFKIDGVRQRFSVKVTWFVKKKPGAGFSPVASSFMKVKP
jgi:hypothetical protein